MTVSSFLLDLGRSLNWPSAVVLLGALAVAGVWLCREQVRHPMAG